MCTRAGAQLASCSKQRIQVESQCLALLIRGSETVTRRSYSLCRLCDERQRKLLEEDQELRWCGASGAATGASRAALTKEEREGSLGVGIGIGAGQLWRRA